MFEEILKNYLTTWRKKQDIIAYLKSQDYFITERTLRNLISKFNRLYGEREAFIAHGPKGYIYTTDKEIIKKSILDNRKRSLRMLKDYQSTVKALSEKNQTDLGIYPIEENAYELLMMSGE